MRHRRKGRKLGRNPSHQRALLRNLASALILTERDTEDLRYLKLESEPTVKGRIVTTVSKAKEVRPLVEKCVTIAKKALAAQEAAQEFATDAERGTDAWKSWRASDRWQQWNQAISPAVAARRRCIQLLGDKHAVSVLFEEVAPRFVDRPGGYTRVVRLAMPRLGDNGTRALLEFVGKNDRVVTKSEKPAFDASEDDEPAGEEEASADAADESTAEDAEAEETTAGEEASEEKKD
ncbi:MAG: bL17 family ribosomal protein [Planctomycetota bacterium]